jgi:hypothetical protein
VCILIINRLSDTMSTGSLALSESESKTIFLSIIITGSSKRSMRQEVRKDEETHRGAGRGV